MRGRMLKQTGNGRFVRQIYYILGSIASQVTLISLLIITNYLFDRNAHQLLAAYYQHAAFLGLNWPLWLTRLGTLGLIIIVMIILSTKE